MLKWGRKEHKKKAQHLVEFALMMPFFIILFSWIFQMMAEVYSKYKFSYVYSSAIANAITYQPVFDNFDDARNYSLSAATVNILKNGLMRSSNSPFSNIEISTIETPRATFLIGVFNFVNTMLFIGETGGAYFYFALPVGSAFVRPSVLNEEEADVQNYFDSYYKIYSSKFCDEIIGGSCDDSYGSGE